MSLTTTQTSLGVSFSGALQASLSVLLTLVIGFGVARFRMISQSTAKEISGLCMNIFLPALLIVRIGKEIGRPENEGQKPLYGSIILWSLFYTLLSVALGYTTQRLLRLPTWTTPAIAFNNTTSLPLLLVQSLETTGFLDALVGSDKASDAVMKAQAFFLVNAMVNKCLVLGFGPRLMFGPGSNAEVEDEEEESRRDSQRSTQLENGRDDDADEGTSLLPPAVTDRLSNARDTVADAADRTMNSLPKPVEKTVNAAASVVNPALVGAFVALVIGLSPNLHAAFFAKPEDGGWFTGWLTSAMQNVGGLFTALQTLVVGANLSSAAEQEVAKRRGEDDSSEEEVVEQEEVSWVALSFVFFYRFVLWTVVSCGLVYVLGAKWRWLGKDPVAWFAMMLMPVGPPAMILVPLIDVNRKRGDKDPKMAVSKVLATMYALTPLICLPVVAALKLSEKMVDEMGL